MPNNLNPAIDAIDAIDVDEISSECSAESSEYNPDYIPDHIGWDPEDEDLESMEEYNSLQYSIPGNSDSDSDSDSEFLPSEDEDEDYDPLEGIDPFSGWSNVTLQDVNNKLQAIKQKIYRRSDALCTNYHGIEQLYCQLNFITVHYLEDLNAEKIKFIETEIDKARCLFLLNAMSNHQNFSKTMFNGRIKSIRAELKKFLREINIGAINIHNQTKISNQYNIYAVLTTLYLIAKVSNLEDQQDNKIKAFRLYREAWKLGKNPPIQTKFVAEQLKAAYELARDSNIDITSGEFIGRTNSIEGSIKKLQEFLANTSEHYDNDGSDNQQNDEANPRQLKSRAPHMNDSNIMLNRLLISNRVPEQLRINPALIEDDDSVAMSDNNDNNNDDNDGNDGDNMVIDEASSSNTVAVPGSSIASGLDSSCGISDLSSVNSQAVGIAGISGIVDVAGANPILFSGVNSPEIQSASVPPAELVPELEPVPEPALAPAAEPEPELSPRVAEEVDREPSLASSDTSSDSSLGADYSSSSRSDSSSSSSSSDEDAPEPAAKRRRIIDDVRELGRNYRCR
jgi:hypothetical protein